MAIKLLVLLCVGLSGCVKRYDLKELRYQQALWYHEGLEEGKCRHCDWVQDHENDDVVRRIFPEWR